MDGENSFERVTLRNGVAIPNLYLSRHLGKNGEWHNRYVAVFRDGLTKKSRRISLGSDLKTARERLDDLLHKNRNGFDFDAEKRAIIERAKVEREKEDVMTVSRWAEVCKTLPEIKSKRSLDRDGDLYGHIVRHLGDKALTEISREDLFTYIEKRRGEKVIRYGKPSKTSVKDGTIKNELSGLRRMLNLASSRGVKTSGVSFLDVLPSATNRTRTLSDKEKTRLLPECEPWLRRLLVTAMETSLSRGDLLRLKWSDIDDEEGVITPDGGRKKTGVRQVAPLTDAVRAVLAEIKADRKKLPAISPLVFLREDARPVNGDMIVTALRNACKAAHVMNFTFHDTRHTAKTNWARAGIPVEAAMLAAGHASVQMHQAYVHLQQSDIAKAFKTSSPFYSGFTSAEKQVSSSDAKS